LRLTGLLQRVCLLSLLPLAYHIALVFRLRRGLISCRFVAAQVFDLSQGILAHSDAVPRQIASNHGAGTTPSTPAMYIYSLSMRCSHRRRKSISYPQRAVIQLSRVRQLLPLILQPFRPSFKAAWTMARMPAFMAFGRQSQAFTTLARSSGISEEFCGTDMAHFECIDVSWERAESVGFRSEAVGVESGNALFWLDFARLCAMFVSEVFVAQEGVTCGSSRTAGANSIEAQPSDFMGGCAFYFCAHRFLNNLDQQRRNHAII